MNKIYGYLILIVLLSCSKTDDCITEKTTLIIGNEEFKLTEKSFYGNENCDIIYVEVGYQVPNDPGFRLKFALGKNGSIRNIDLVFARARENKQYESADFNPSGLLSIRNFIYNPSKNYLHFEFQGDLVEVDGAFSTIDIPKDRKYIKGIFTTDNLIKTVCNSAIGNLNFETNNLTFLGNNYFGNFNISLTTNPYQFYFYSDNGYRTIIKSKVDLWNLEKGTYNFDQNSIENRIDFEQYMGIFRATQLLWIRDIDWKKYQTSGSYTILGHQIINGQKVTNGEFNLQIFDNGVSKHNIINAKFEVIGF
jgi:hypothetical protein